MAYPRGSSAWRQAEWGEACHPHDMVEMAIYTGSPTVWVHRLVRPAVTLLGAVFVRRGYIVRRAGGYNCRLITGGKSKSSHAWGISIDVNDDTNPYRKDKLVTDMSDAMIADVYAIRTVAGVRVWRWGGDWDMRPDTTNSNYDSMHFECIATPGELAMGFSHDVPTVYDPLHFPVIRRGAHGAVVVVLQGLLGMQRTTGDGIFGQRTEQAVRLYQASRGLTADGIVGRATWTALLTNQPPLAAGAPTPQRI